MGPGHKRRETGKGSWSQEGRETGRRTSCQTGRRTSYGAWSQEGRETGRGSGCMQGRSLPVIWVLVVFDAAGHSGSWWCHEGIESVCVCMCVHLMPCVHGKGAQTILLCWRNAYQNVLRWH